MKIINDNLHQAIAAFCQCVKENGFDDLDDSGEL